MEVGRKAGGGSSRNEEGGWRCEGKVESARGVPVFRREDPSWGCLILSRAS